MSDASFFPFVYDTERKEAFFAPKYLVGNQKPTIHSTSSIQGYTERLAQLWNKDTCFSEDKHALIGIEIELENYHKAITDPRLTEVFQADTDDSLRNNGIEFKTKVPTPLIYMPHIMREFDKYRVEAGLVASSRCSTHIHVNINHLPYIDVETYIAFYNILEPLFFSFVDQERKRSNFCVPSANYQNNIPFAFHNPLKYTALSTFRMHDLGTMEFRQFGGFNDFGKLYNWMLLINNFNTFLNEVIIFKRDSTVWNTFKNSKSRIKEVVLPYMMRNIQGVSLSSTVVDECVNNALMQAMTYESSLAASDKANKIFSIGNWAADSYVLKMRKA